MHDICFVLRPEQLESRGPAFHFFIFQERPITPDHSTKCQNDLETGKKKKFFSGQFHNLNRKGEGKSVFSVRFFFNLGASNTFLLLV